MDDPDNEPSALGVHGDEGGDVQLGFLCLLTALVFVNSQIEVYEPDMTGVYDNEDDHLQLALLHLLLLLIISNTPIEDCRPILEVLAEEGFRLEEYRFVHSLLWTMHRVMMRNALFMNVLRSFLEHYPVLARAPMNCGSDCFHLHDACAVDCPH